MSVPFPKVGVIGGGIFGCMTALALGENGFSVTVFERQPAIMFGGADPKALGVCASMPALSSTWGASFARARTCRARRQHPSQRMHP